jgi:hypothetical protein
MNSFSFSIMPQQPGQGRDFNRIFNRVKEMEMAGHEPLGAVVRPDIEDALKDPKKWNAHWEKAMSPKLNGGLEFPPQAWYENEIREYKAMTRQHPDLLDALYNEYPVNLKQTLALQVAMIQDVCTFGRKGFDAQWRAAAPSLRKKHVLLALSRTCSAANNLHEARKYCATELNLAYLTENGRDFSRS